MPDNADMLPSLDEIWYVNRLPWLLPGITLATIAVVGGGTRFAHWLGVPRLVAWVIIMSTGLILTGTVTPLALEFRSEAQPLRSCDISRIGPAIPDLTKPSDALFNILMFIPLGLAIAFAPVSPRKALVLAGAIALPFLIEAAQFTFPQLGRGCESADVVDNLTGLLLGVAAGTVLAWLKGPDQIDAGIKSQ